MSDGLSESARLSRRRMFDAQAVLYAARRPGYPRELFDRIATYGDLAEGARVLEVAPGTGQATLSMARCGWTVTAVELGERLAAAARRTLAPFPNVEVVVGAFEDWRLPQEPFDAVVCATAFHWLDPVTRLEKMAQALRPRGVVGIIWTHHVAGGSDAFFSRAQDCYGRWDATADARSRLPSEDEVVSSDAELTSSPHFVDVQSHRFAVELTYTAETYLDLVRTYSATMMLSDERRAGLLSCLGGLINGSFDGEVTKRHLFELVLARRS